MTFQFNPTDGYRDKVSFPTKPANETAFRDQMMSLLDQIRDFLNGVDPSSPVKKSGDTMTGNLTVQKSYPQVILRTPDGVGDTQGFVVNINGVNAAYLIYVPSTGAWGLRKMSSDGVTIMSRVELYGDKVNINGMEVFRSQVSPEGSITSGPGSICSVWSGSTSIGLWVKISGTGNTGWQRVQTA